MALAVGFAVTYAFVLAGAALHAYADTRAVAARDAIRIVLVTLVGANTVGAAFFAIRAIPSRPILGSLGAFAAALGAVIARLAVLTALRVEDARNAAIAAAAAPESSREGSASGAILDSAGTSEDQPVWPHTNGVIPVAHDALLVLIGAAGCGKSTFAAKRFERSRIVSSDECRILISDDVRKTSADAFRLMYQLVGMRLKRGKLTVADATNVSPDKRAELLAIAKQHRRPAVAIVFDLPEQLCRDRNEARSDRVVPVPAIRGQMKHVREALPRLAEEGFSAVHVLKTAADLDDVRVVVEEPKGSASGGRR